MGDEFQLLGPAGSADPIGTAIHSPGEGARSMRPLPFLFVYLPRSSVTPAAVVPRDRAIMYPARFHDTRGAAQSVSGVQCAPPSTFRARPEWRPSHQGEPR